MASAFHQSDDCVLGHASRIRERRERAEVDDRALYERLKEKYEGGSST